MVVIIALDEALHTFTRASVGGTLEPSGKLGIIHKGPTLDEIRKFVLAFAFIAFSTVFSPFIVAVVLVLRLTELG